MNTKSKIFGVIVQKNDTLNNLVVTESVIKSFLEDNCDYINFYAFILHDIDKKEDGTLKEPHYHIIIKCNNAYAKETILNDFVKHLVKNRNGVSVRAVNDFEASIQYLIHKNDICKAQYLIQDVISNDVGYLVGIMQNPLQVNNLDIEKIIQLVIESSSLVEVYQKVGLKNAKEYRNVIKDIYERKN